MGRPRKDDGDNGQQDLIDVEPENMKVILSKARRYLKLKGECSEANEAAKKALQSAIGALTDQVAKWVFLR